MTYILGISAYYHDSAAVLLHDGDIVAAAQEERFTRKRHDAAFPKHSIEFCLQQAGIAFLEIDNIVFYDKPLLKFERLLETHIATAPFGFPAFLKAMPVWLNEKLYLKKLLRDALSELGQCDKQQLPALLFSTHHQAHAASAFYASPYDKAVVLCLDGVGEWATTTVWAGEGNQLSPLWQINFPHSAGLLYSAFTSYAGFRVNSGEYKLMGLAPYGEAKYADLILQHIIDLKEDGSFRLDMSYFNFASGLTMTSKKFHALFGREPRLAESEITQHDMDIAKSIQVVIEEIVLRLAKTLRHETGLENICLAGGVALNCVANGKLLEAGIFKNIWVQPAAGDAGGALGAAYLVWYQYLNNQRKCSPQDQMHGALLGTEYSDAEIEKVLLSAGAVYEKHETSALFKTVAQQLDNTQVVGWFQGRMEFGPRALGSRSILGDARSASMQTTINLKIKNRESFRPFAPAVLQDNLKQWFDMSANSPYMLFVAQLNKAKCFIDKTDDSVRGLDKLKQQRSQVPAVTHVDNSARVQTVSADSNPLFYQLLTEFEQQTQCPILINTSFNVRGEPIVESPQDALYCFMKTDMDVLAIGSFVLLKQHQNKTLHEIIQARSVIDQQTAAEAQAEQVSSLQLRQFALIMGVMLTLILGWFIPWLSDSAFNRNILLFTVPWVIWGGVFPNTIKPLYRGWMRFGIIMSKFTGPLILGIIYFGLIAPMGLIMKILNSDPLKRKLDAKAQSYRVESETIAVENMEKPF